MRIVFPSKQTADVDHVIFDGLWIIRTPEVTIVTDTTAAELRFMAEHLVAVADEMDAAEAVDMDAEP